MRHSFQNIAVCVVVVAGLSSCILGPDYQRSAMGEPNAYRADYPSGDSIANIKWWDLYQDSVLQYLILQALVTNRELKSSVSRMKEAEANMGIVRANLYPSINYALDANATWSATDDGGGRHG